MSRDKWIWMPHTAYFNHHCRFRLSTYVNGYIVSTVGELPKPPLSLPSAHIATSFQDIGVDRKYETMVFKAEKSNHECCPYKIESGDELDFKGYSDPDSATKGHYELCEKWDVGGVVDGVSITDIEHFHPLMFDLSPETRIEKGWKKVRITVGKKKQRKNKCRRMLRPEK